MMDVPNNDYGDFLMGLEQEAAAYQIMTTEEQKWLVEKLGGCWHEWENSTAKIIYSKEDNSYLGFGYRCKACSFKYLNRDNWSVHDSKPTLPCKNINPTTLPGYEWARQRMCNLGLMEPFASFVEELYQRPAYTLLSLTPAEKSKLIYDFLKERK
jgi:hypothetical protein